MKRNHCNDYLTGFILLIVIALSACSAENHLEQAIQHTKAASQATEGKSIAKHAQSAKDHATDAKNAKPSQKHSPHSGEHLVEGIRNLDQAIEKGNLDAVDSAKQAAEEALNHLQQAKN